MPSISIVERPDGAMPRRCTEKRTCVDCGCKINSYHQPRRIKRIRCYSCEDKRPWTYEYIVEG